MNRLAKIVTATIFVILILVAAMFWFRTYNMFVLNKVVVKGLDLVSRDEVLELARPDFSKEIFHQDIRGITQRIESHPLIERVRVHRFLPSGLYIQVKERDLVAVVPGERLAVVDKDASVAMVDNFYALYDLPAITGSTVKKDSSGALVVDSHTASAIRLLCALRELDWAVYHDVSEVHIDEKKGLVLFLRTHLIPVLFGEGDLSGKLLNFLTLYRHLQSRNQLAEFKGLDLRYSGQVVGKL